MRAMPSWKQTTPLVLLAALLAAAAAVVWWPLDRGALGRTETLALRGLTASGPGVRLERVSTGMRLHFRRGGAQLEIPVGQVDPGRVVRLRLADVEGLAWVMVSSSKPQNELAPDPLGVGRVFPPSPDSKDLDFPLRDGAHGSIHVALRGHGSRVRLTVQSIELRSVPPPAPPAAVVLSAGLLAGGVLLLAWILLSVWGRATPPERRRLAAAGAAFLGGATLLLFVGLALEGPAEAEGSSTLRGALEKTTAFPERLLGEVRADLESLRIQSAARSGGGLRRLRLYLSPQALATLDRKREEALTQGNVLISEEGDEVTGHLALDDGEPMRVSTRLKGDWVDHLRGRASSLRIRVRGQQAILGMRRFSIQRPGTRVGHYEVLILDHMRDEGIITPRYDFVRFSLNDEPLGVMALEEFMSKELLEANGRREGVILALDEQYLWRQRRMNALLENPPPSGRGLRPVELFEQPHLSPLRTFQERAVLQDPTLRHQYREALGLMRGYIEGRLAAEEVFDLPRLGRFYAIVNLWDVAHATWWHNVRVYFNPVTRLFEPVAFDNNVPITAPRTGTKKRWLGSSLYRVRGAPRFLDAYWATLRRVREQIDSGAFEERIRRWEARHYGLLERQDSQDPPYPMHLMHDRLAVLERTRIARNADLRYVPRPPKPLRPHSAVDTFVHVYWVSAAEGAYLEFQNITDRPVVVERIEYRYGRLASPIPVASETLQVPPADRPGERLRLPVPYDPLDLDGQILVVATLDDENAGRLVAAHRYFPAAEEARFRPDTRESFLGRFPFVVFEPGRGYRIPEGDWEVESSLLVPDDAPLTIDPGATLRFAAGARLVLRTAVVAKGRPEKPIRLLAEAGPWGGLVVLQAAERSELEHVEITAVDYPSDDRWRLTGAVTFYESDVDMTEFRVIGAQTEDALNLLRSDFRLEGIGIDHVPSDAIDVDFGRGVITRSRFTDVGGDALDVSGTEVTLEDLVIRGARDKAVSVGEASTLSARGLDIADVGTGIASKDGSLARLSDSLLADVEHSAFMAYVKKPEFGPARLEVVRTGVERVGLPAIAVGASTVEIDGKSVARTELDVRRLYRTGYMAR
jgi:hypothetical protein